MKQHFYTLEGRFLRQGTSRVSLRKIQSPDIYSALVVTTYGLVSHVIELSFTGRVADPWQMQDTSWPESGNNPPCVLEHFDLFGYSFGVVKTLPDLLCHPHCILFQRCDAMSKERSTKNGKIVEMWTGKWRPQKNMMLQRHATLRNYLQTRKQYFHSRIHVHLVNLKGMNILVMESVLYSAIDWWMRQVGLTAD